MWGRGEPRFLRAGTANKAAAVVVVAVVVAQFGLGTGGVLIQVLSGQCQVSLCGVLDKLQMERSRT